MPRHLHITRDLKKIADAVESRIRNGAFDLNGNREQMLRLNSVIYADIRACLQRKLSSKKNAKPGEKDLFTAKMLEEVAHADGTGTEAIVRKAYIAAAGTMEKQS